MTSKNVFLDLGTHYGQGLRQFIRMFRMDEEWEIHTFEANPITFDIFKKQFYNQTPWVKSYNKAISDNYGNVKINIESPPNEGETGAGSSIIDLDEWDPWEGKLRNNFKTSALVDCIDLSDFIIKNFNKTDNIIVKMDIEGSEYHTLEKMIEDKSIDYISKIFVEWHSGFFSDQVKDSIIEREKNIKDYMKKNNIHLEDWW